MGDLIVVGDKTSTGGSVLLGNSSVKINGKDIALIGGMATCMCGIPTCTKQGVIMKKTPRAAYLNGVEFAKAGDMVMTSCGLCTLLPSPHQITLGSMISKVNFGNAINLGNGININKDVSVNIDNNEKIVQLSEVDNIDKSVDESIGAEKGSVNNIEVLNYQAMRDMQLNKIKINCTRSATKIAKYLITKNESYLSAPWFKKLNHQTKEEMILDINKNNFLTKNNRIIDRSKEDKFIDIDVLEQKLKSYPFGSIGYFFGALRVDGEVGMLGHVFVAYNNAGRIEYFDSTTPMHFDLINKTSKKYFDEGFFSHSKQKQARWVGREFKAIFILPK